MERLKSSLQFAPEAEIKRGKHIVFVDTAEEVESFDPVVYFDTVPEALDNPVNRPKLSQLQDEDFVVNIDAPDLETVKNERLSSFNELNQRIEREKQIDISLRKLALQRRLMQKGKKFKIAPETELTPAVFRWERVRKR